MKYYEAAKNGEKMESVIKDFASIIHQLGETSKAVSFLKELSDYAKNNLDAYQYQKFENLKKNFINQKDDPTGKHNITKLMIDLKDLPTNEVRGNKTFIRKVFRDASRV